MRISCGTAVAGPVLGVAGVGLASVLAGKPAYIPAQCMQPGLYPARPCLQEALTHDKHLQSDASRWQAPAPIHSSQLSNCAKSDAGLPCAGQASLRVPRKISGPQRQRAKSSATASTRRGPGCRPRHSHLQGTARCRKLSGACAACHHFQAAAHGLLPAKGRVSSIEAASHPPLLVHPTKLELAFSPTVPWHLSRRHCPHCPRPARYRHFTEGQPQCPSLHQSPAVAADGDHLFLLAPQKKGKKNQQPGCCS